MEPSKISIDAILFSVKVMMKIMMKKWWCFDSDDYYKSIDNDAMLFYQSFVVCDLLLCFQVTHRYQVNESDGADCNEAAMISFTEPVYKIPLSCLHQTSDQCCHVPPIPPRKHIPMNSSQQDLFNWIPPPPQSMSPATEYRSRTLAQSSSLRTVIRNSCLSLPR